MQYEALLVDNPSLREVCMNDDVSSVAKCIQFRTSLSACESVIKKK